MDHVRRKKPWTMYPAITTVGQRIPEEKTAMLCYRKKRSNTFLSVQLICYNFAELVRPIAMVCSTNLF